MPQIIQHLLMEGIRQPILIHLNENQMAIPKFSYGSLENNNILLGLELLAKGHNSTVFFRWPKFKVLTLQNGIVCMGEFSLTDIFPEILMPRRA